ncbi:MAG: hypothetical protein AAFV96_02255, partial [Pseudomonadota bacterium]
MTDAFVAVLTAAGGVSDDAVKAARAALHGRAALIETARWASRRWCNSSATKNASSKDCEALSRGS